MYFNACLCDSRPWDAQERLQLKNFLYFPVSLDLLLDKMVVCKPIAIPIDFNQSHYFQVQIIILIPGFKKYVVTVEGTEE